jgi:hypothetical protein
MHVLRCVATESYTLSFGCNNHAGLDNGARHVQKRGALLNTDRRKAVKALGRGQEGGGEGGELKEETRSETLSY